MDNQNNALQRAGDAAVSAVSNIDVNQWVKEYMDKAENRGLSSANYALKQGQLGGPGYAFAMVAEKFFDSYQESVRSKAALQQSMAEIAKQVSSNQTKLQQEIYNLDRKRREYMDKAVSQYYKHIEDIKPLFQKACNTENPDLSERLLQRYTELEQIREKAHEQTMEMWKKNCSDPQMVETCQRQTNEVIKTVMKTVDSVSKQSRNELVQLIDGVKTLGGQNKNEGNIQGTSEANEQQNTKQVGNEGSSIPSIEDSCSQQEQIDHSNQQPSSGSNAALHNRGHFANNGDRQTTNEAKQTLKEAEDFYEKAQDEEDNKEKRQLLRKAKKRFEELDENCLSNRHRKFKQKHLDSIAQELRSLQSSNQIR